MMTICCKLRRRALGRAAVLATALAAAPTCEADRIVLVGGGDTLHGRVTGQTGESVVFEHSALGRLVIARSAIASLTLDGEDGPTEPAPPPPAVEAAPQEAPPAGTAAEAPAAPAPDPWTWRFEFGLNGSEGRTEKLDGRINFLAQRRTDETRLALDANYRTATSRGDHTQNKFDAGAIHDWYWNDSPWLAFVQGRFELDEFADYDQRYSAGGGLGYSFIKSDRTELVGRAGLGGAMERGGPNDGDITPEGIIKIDLTHTLTEITRLTAGGEYYPDLNRFGDFRAILNTAIETRLSATSPASLKFGVRYEVEDRHGISQDDLFEYFALFVVEF